MNLAAPLTLELYAAPTCACGQAIRGQGKLCQQCARKAGGLGRRGSTRRGAVVRSDGGQRETPAAEYDCRGEPGPCGHVGCPMNLVLDVSDAGTITVYGTPDVPSLRVKATGLTAYAEAAQAELVSATVDARLAWLDAEWGSSCAAWIVRAHGRLSSAQVASIFRVSRQRSEIDERKALVEISRPAERLYTIRLNKHRRRP